MSAQRLIPPIFGVVTTFSFVGTALANSSADLNFYGVPGLIDMPSASSLPDGELATTFTNSGATKRATLTFQISPRLLGSFRYSIIEDFDAIVGQDRFDRSFDLQYRLLDEKRIRPSVTIGLQDFIGSGIYAGEYIVATKHIGSKFTVTGGVGWGRYGTYKGFSNPLGGFSDSFNNRPTDYDAALGEQVLAGQWFRGDMGVFAGFAWETPIENLTFKAEYSSDAYVPETSRNLMEHNSPINVGLEYKVRENSTLGLYYRYGSEVGLRFSSTFNPKRPLNKVRSIPPLPVLPRGQAVASRSDEALADELSALMSQEGLDVESAEITGNRLTVRFRNTTYDLPAQAVGRAARTMTYAAPASIDEFVIIPVEKGLSSTAVTVQRADLEALINDPDATLKSANISASYTAVADVQPARRLYPNIDAKIRPYLNAHLFDPDEPLRVDGGLRASARAELARGFSINGSVAKRVIGNIDENTRTSDSKIQRVRSDLNLYQVEGDPVVERLTADYLFQISPSVYGRFSAGYLEQMYGGVSAEVLWKPYDKKWALGAEVNAVRQRDFDQLLGFQEYETVTGHASLYWDMGNGFQAQIDAGRYLAQDWGGTMAVDRVFDNGWKVGAYMTLTDVSFDDFGEGRFDKGIRLTIPMSWAVGEPKRKRFDITIQPVYRDGGAKLNVSDRLHPILKEADERALLLNWDKFGK